MELWMISIAVAWVFFLTLFVIRTVSHYNRLTHGVTSRTLRDVLEQLLANQTRTIREIEKIQNDIKKLEDAGTYHFQRLGIVRYNPFSDTGGSQSFTIALLDGRDNGIVMTSLYARTGNRWYIKYVRKGTSQEVELSKEEQTAIKKARPITEVS